MGPTRDYNITQVSCPRTSKLEFNKHFSLGQAQDRPQDRSPRVLGQDRLRTTSGLPEKFRETSKNCGPEPVLVLMNLIVFVDFL